jgi:hypothetical protein
MARSLHLASPHMRGADVAEAQKTLVRSKYGSFLPASEVDGEFGPITGNACVAAKWALGYAQRDCVQTYGDLLHGFLSGHHSLPHDYLSRRAQRQAAAKVDPGARALREAARHIGYVESPPGSNRSKFGAWYGANPCPWCAEFVSYCFTVTGRSLKYAYVPFLLADARAGRHGLFVVSIRDTRPGDILTYDWQHDGVSDHTGIAESPVRGGEVHTIEGNTSSDDGGDQSNGGCVARKVRAIGYISGVIRVKGL